MAKDILDPERYKKRRKRIQLPPANLTTGQARRPGNVPAPPTPERVREARHNASLDSPGGKSENFKLSPEMRARREAYHERNKPRPASERGMFIGGEYKSPEQFLSPAALVRRRELALERGEGSDNAVQEARRAMDRGMSVFDLRKEVEKDREEQKKHERELALKTEPERVRGQHNERVAEIEGKYGIQSDATKSFWKTLSDVGKVTGDVVDNILERRSDRQGDIRDRRESFEANQALLGVYGDRMKNKVSPTALDKMARTLSPTDMRLVLSQETKEKKPEIGGPAKADFQGQPLDQADRVTQDVIRLNAQEAYNRARSQADDLGEVPSLDAYIMREALEYGYMYEPQPESEAIKAIERASEEDPLEGYIDDN